jgi:hypothetical protein
MLAVVIFIAVVPLARAQEDKVFRALSPEATEKLLQELKIEFTKTSAKKGNEHYFEFTRNAFKVRLTHFSPQEIKLDCVFRGISLETVNQWNFSTRYGRAIHFKDGSNEITLLEYCLDLSGGVTAGTIKQFVHRFDDELKKYDKYVNGALADDVILAEVTNDKLENILKTQGINYTKKTNKAGVIMFDFELNTHKLRLYNFGGKDLMIDVHYRKISLEDANRYNLNRKFIRVVNYKGKDVEYTALECNLDCEAGVSEGMIRHWILSFGEDAQHFGEYTKKLQTAQKK